MISRRSIFRSLAMLVQGAPGAACAFGSTVSPASSGAAGRGALSGRVQLRLGKRDKPDQRGVVVHLEDVPGELPDTSNLVHEVRQVHKTFLPEVSVVLKGTTVSFPNDDRVFHNVYSVSRPARFDLGLYKSGTTKTVVLKRAGVVEIFCNIHPEMVAKVLVLDTAYYGTTDRKGDFAIADIPAGTYRFTAWQAWGEPKSGKIRIEAGETAHLEVELVEKGRPNHLRKDGSPYGRYQ